MKKIVSSLAVIALFVSFGVYAYHLNKATKYASEGDSQLAAVTRNTNNYTLVQTATSSKKCKCPPKVIFVGGIYSKPEDPFAKKIKEYSGSSFDSYISFNEANANPNYPGDVDQVKKKLKKRIAEIGKDQSLLVIGFSAGSTIKTVVEEMKKEGYCITFLALDPPYQRSNICYTIIPPIPSMPFFDFDNVANQWRKINNAICSAKLSTADGIVWTGGNAQDTQTVSHDPTTSNNPQNAEILKKIKDAIDSYKRSCPAKY